MQLLRCYNCNLHVLLSISSACEKVRKQAQGSGTGQWHRAVAQASGTGQWHRTVAKFGKDKLAVFKSAQEGSVIR